MDWFSSFVVIVVHIPHTVQSSLFTQLSSTKVNIGCLPKTAFDNFAVEFEPLSNYFSHCFSFTIFAYCCLFIAALTKVDVCFSLKNTVCYGNLTCFTFKGST